jgi:hypothetical protein
MPTAWMTCLIESPPRALGRGRLRGAASRSEDGVNTRLLSDQLMSLGSGRVAHRGNSSWNTLPYLDKES